MHHQFGSQALVDTLHSISFASSYNEATEFERNAALAKNVALDIQATSFVQYVADNTDRNTFTLDGNGTFHGMTIIASITPKIKRSIFTIPRVQVFTFHEH